MSDALAVGLGGIFVFGIYGLIVISLLEDILKAVKAMRETPHDDK